jgi:hypothetical protein
VPRIKNAFEVVLPGNRLVVLVELGAGDLQQAFRLAGNEKAKGAQDFAQSMEGLKLSIREVDGQKVSYDKLAGNLWDEHFSLRETILLQREWERIHMPTDAESEAVGRKAVAEASSGG